MFRCDYSLKKYIKKNNLRVRTILQYCYVCERTGENEERKKKYAPRGTPDNLHEITE